MPDQSIRQKHHLYHVIYNSAEEGRSKSSKRKIIIWAPVSSTSYPCKEVRNVQQRHLESKTTQDANGQREIAKK